MKNIPLQRESAQQEICDARKAAEAIAYLIDHPMRCAAAASIIAQVLFRRMHIASEEEEDLDALISLTGRVFNVLDEDLKDLYPEAIARHLSEMLDKPVILEKRNGENE